MNLAKLPFSYNTGSLNGMYSSYRSNSFGGGYGSFGSSFGSFGSSFGSFGGGFGSPYGGGFGSFGGGFGSPYGGGFGSFGSSFGSPYGGCYGLAALAAPIGYMIGNLIGNLFLNRDNGPRHQDCNCHDKSFLADESGQGGINIS